MTNLKGELILPHQRSVHMSCIKPFVAPEGAKSVKYSQVKCRKETTSLKIKKKKKKLSLGVE